MVNVISALSSSMPDPGGMWEWFLFKVFDFIGNYGWRIIVFTILLKLVLSPLDIFQRLMMRKNQKITERIKPEMDKLQYQYGSNKQILSQKQMELNKREGMSYLSTCLPMIVTLVVFFSLFSGMQNMSRYMTMKQYLQMYDVYQVKYEQVLKDGGVEDGVLVDKSKVEYTPGGSAQDRENDEVRYRNLLEESAVTSAQNEVYTAYNEEYKIEFLWIKNIWSPDVVWKKPILDKAGFEGAVGAYAKEPERTGLTSAELTNILNQYDLVTSKLQKDESNKINGWLLLPILSVGLSFLSQFITTRQQKKSGQAAAQGTTAASTMKIMMFAMPVMMGFFALSYTSVFTLYIITNSAMTLFLNLTTTGVIKLFERRSYKTGKIVSLKKGKDYTSDTVIKYGRQDPNEIKNDTKNDNKNQRKK